jgi:hypothetical protein
VVNAFFESLDRFNTPGEPAAAAGAAGAATIGVSTPAGVVPAGSGGRTVSTLSFRSTGGGTMGCYMSMIMRPNNLCFLRHGESRALDNRWGRGEGGFEDLGKLTTSDRVVL